MRRTSPAATATFLRATCRGRSCPCRSPRCARACTMKRFRPRRITSGTPPRARSNGVTKRVVVARVRKTFRRPRRVAGAAATVWPRLVAGRACSAFGTPSRRLRSPTHSDRTILVPAVADGGGGSNTRCKRPAEEERRPNRPGRRKTSKGRTVLERYSGRASLRPPSSYDEHVRDTCDTTICRETRVSFSCFIFLFFRRRMLFRAAQKRLNIIRSTCRRPVNVKSSRFG